MTPLLTPEFVLLPGYSGILYAINKFDGRPLYRFPAGPPLTAQVGQYTQFKNGHMEYIAYIASQDYTVVTRSRHLARPYPVAVRRRRSNPRQAGDPR